ncbi:DUF6250 domain-containing protein [Massilia sp. TS11]|uniref:DUF6250 domain-containing protein n=1 Tax=Massilia sp. TS11 TaxID=2908003 RepID=UPI001EDB3147|nr:DUF6250 domain-containing protein [Massilia sp. TS11]MCG2583939.1 DUF6250 domain-containing protein [Massilia sp. TS11]
MLAAALTAACVFGAPGRLLASDDFSGPLDQWVSEVVPAAHASIRADQGSMLLDVDAGATAWLRQPLQGRVLIHFERQVLPEGRLSDLNMFWMAQDPRQANLFTRSGKFEDYDSVRMYYLGIGGNTNTTTRLRRYDGAGEKRILGEYLDPAHLLRPGHWYAIDIAVADGCTRVQVDGQTWFQFRDPEPLQSGWFGIRTTQSRQRVRALRVYELKQGDTP